MERVKATVVATKDSDVKPYVLPLRSRFTGEINTEVIDVRVSYVEPVARFSCFYVDGKES